MIAEPGPMCFSAARESVNMESTLIWNVVATCSSESSSGESATSCLPALFTRMSRPPSSFAAASTRPAV